MTNGTDKAGSFVKQFDERVSHLEVAVGKLQMGMEGIARELGEQAANFKQLNTSLSAIGRPQWGTWLSGAMLIFAVTTGTIGLYIQPIRADSIHNKELLNRLDVTLQREMRLMDEKIQSDVVHLDEQLRRDLQEQRKFRDDRFDQFVVADSQRMNEVDNKVSLIEQRQRDISAELSKLEGYLKGVKVLKKDEGE